MKTNSIKNMYLIISFMLSALIPCFLAQAEQQLNVDNFYRQNAQATFAQLLLFDQAKKEAGFLPAHVHIVASHTAKISNYVATNISMLYMIHGNNLDDRLFTLYHELGHQNDDFYNRINTDFISSTEFINDIPEIAQYIELGQKTLDYSSRIGSTIKNAIQSVSSEKNIRDSVRLILPVILAPITVPLTFIDKFIQLQLLTKESINLKNIAQFTLQAFQRTRIIHPFWIQPLEAKKLQEYSYWRRSEQYADLFALKKLFEQNLIQTIIRWAEYFISCGGNHTKLCPLEELYIISRNYKNGTQDQHPSHIERVVYMLGFLAAHGIDINKALRDYEAHGQCVDAENLKAIADYLKLQKCPAAQ